MLKKIKLAIYNIFLVIGNLKVLKGTLFGIYKMHKMLRRYPGHKFFDIFFKYDLGNGTRLVIFENTLIGSLSYASTSKIRLYDNFIENLEGTKKINGEYKFDFKFPALINLSITEVCYFNCAHCSAGRRKNQKIMEKENAIKLIKELSEKVVSIGITGGEPLTHPDLCEILSAIDHKNIYSVVCSTGYSLTQDKAKKIKETGLFGVNISLESNDENRMDTIKGYKGAYKIALNAIDYFLKAGLFVSIYILASKDKIISGELDETLKFAKKLGAHQCIISQVSPAGKLYSGNYQDKYLLNYEDQKYLKELQYRANNDFKNYTKTQCLIHNEFGSFGCAAGSLYAYVETTGELYPCDTLEISYGNVFKDGFLKSYNNMKRFYSTPSTNCISLCSRDKLKKCEKIPKIGFGENESDECFTCKDKKIPKYIKNIFGE